MLRKNENGRIAWIKGEESYVLGDTVQDVARKAEGHGYKPGSQGYIAFLDGFLAKARGGAPTR